MSGPGGAPPPPSAAGLTREQEAFWRGAHSDGPTRFTNLKLVGQGAYSVVGKATDTQTGKFVAIKRVGEVFYDAMEAKKVLREIRLLRDFHHPNIIALHLLIPPASMDNFDEIFMVTDYMDLDLRKVIKSRRELSPNTICSYMAQLLSALQHVHAISGIHRDLKPANVLVTSDGLLRLCDFGLARTTLAEGRTESKRELDAGTEVENDGGEGGDDAAPPPLKHQLTNYVVTRWYRAPEVILQEPYSSAIDIWSVGCIFKELLELTPGSKFKTGALFPGRYCIPFSFDDDQRSRQRHDQLAVIVRVLQPPINAELAWASSRAQAEVERVCGGWSKIEPAQRAAQRLAMLERVVPHANALELDLLSSLLSLDPSVRLSAGEALKHSYFDMLERRPPTTAKADSAAIEAAFAFENETLGVNELRILLTNDLFRYRLAEGASEDTSTE